MKRILGILAVILPLQISNAAYAQMPQVEPMRYVSVTGEAEMDVAPDQAILNLSVVSRHVNLQEAKTQNDKLTQTVLGIAKEFDIPEKDLKTSRLHISPEYSYENRKQKHIGYMVNRSLRITMTKMDIHERLLSRVVDAGVDNVNGVEFAIARPEEHAQKLRGLAVENARGRAEVLAKAGGVILGKPISISSGGTPPIMPPVPLMAKAMHMEAADAGGSVAPSLPGMIVMREQVSVVFAIE